MPFEIMDQRNALVSSRYFDDIGFPAETQVGFCKPNTMSNNQDKVVGSSPLKKLSVVSTELPPSDLVRDQERLGIGWKGITKLSEPSWNPMNHHPKSPSNLYVQPAVNFNGNNIRVNVIQHESSLFSSSFSEIFSRKLKLLGNDLSFQHAGKAATHHEEEPFKSMEEIEAQTIGNLLPDEDDLFSGVNDELGLTSHAGKGNELEDFDLFSSGGGMELEGDNHVFMRTRNSDLIGVFNGQKGSNGITLNSSSTITDMASCVGPLMAEGLDNRHVRGASSNGHLMEPNAGVFRSSGNGSSSLNANHYSWNNSNSLQQHPSDVMVWPNSPSFVNSFHGSHLPQIPAFSRAPPVMLNVGSPLSHQIGSAPPVNSAFWDRRHPYTGESPETSGFHLGSLGNVGFTGSSPSNPVEIASHKFFSHVGGNYMNLTKNGGVHSPQRMCHLIPGRNPMTSVPASLDTPNARVRSFSHRRNESNPTNVDKKQYELDIDRIIRGDENRTTLMIKNIPNKYTSKMLLAAIDEHCRGTYDFIYLPIDFKNKCNVGYAFINMIDPQQIIPLYKAFNGKKWEKFNSEKVASLTYGRIQGKAALIAHFQNSSLMNEDKRCRPILFHTCGPNAGDQEPFPIGTNIRSRPGRPRTTNSEENRQQGSSSTLANGDIFSNGADS